MYELYWSPATGAFVVEAVLEELGLAYERVSTITGQGEHRRPEYVAMNPLQQIPSLRLPDGTVMTETAAIVMHLCDCRPEAGLLPEPGTSERARAYRWLVLLAVNFYEADLRFYYPDRYTADPNGLEGVKQSAVQRMDRLLEVIEKGAGARALAAWASASRRSISTSSCWLCGTRRGRRCWTSIHGWQR